MVIVSIPYEMLQSLPHGKHISDNIILKYFNYFVGKYIKDTIIRYTGSVYFYLAFTAIICFGLTIAFTLIYVKVEKLIKTKYHYYMPKT